MDIVFVASWFPSKLNPELGNFVQRHAEAVAESGVRVKVIHVAFSNKVVFPKIEQEEVNTIRILHLFLPKIGSQSGFLRQYWSNIMVKKISENGFIPELIHCHIAYPAGDFAIHLSENLNIPLVYTEHWSRFNRTGTHEPLEDIEKQIRHVASRSLTILPVSKFLEKMMQKSGIQGNYKVIENAVDTKYFYPFPRKNHGEFTFLHISNFEPGIKNTESIIKSFSELKRNDARLIIAGDGDLNPLKRFCKSENIDIRNIHFQGKQTYPEVAKLNQESDCFILFSNSENLPCVIAEALCCGNPVIATRVGGIAEMITKQNGRIVPPNAIDDLKREMEYVIKEYNLFDKNQISETAACRYGYVTIGNAFLSVYQSALADSKLKHP